MPQAQRIGPYEVLFELASGGMGTVYLARALGAPVGADGFERLVAIKRMHLHLSSDDDAVRRFLDEAKVAARIHHAHVVGVHQVGSDENGHFLVQDYIEGDTLQGLIDHATLKRRRLPPPVVLRIALDALSGLSAVHEATDEMGRPLGILHRDTSTQNLLVGRDGVTRLADFGIAKHALRSVVTDGRYLQGRVLYMPPEYLARRPIDQRFDVYGMGITLWTALSGEAPWADASDAQLVSLAVQEGVPPLTAGGLAIAPAVESIVARACQRDPDARFASAREMLAAIEDLGRHTGWVASHGEVAELVEQLAGKELGARRESLVHARAIAIPSDPTPAAMVRPPRPPERSRPLRSVGVAIALVGVGALGTVMLVRRPPTPPTAAAAPPPVVSAAPMITATPTATAVVSAAPSATAVESAAPVKPAAIHTSRPRQSASPTPTPPPPTGPTAPSTITTANPYRQ